MFAVEDSLKKELEKQKLNPNLLRVYLKETHYRLSQSVDFNDKDKKYLYKLAKYNNLSDWDMQAIYNAKQNRIKQEKIFTKEKWLDSYFVGISERKSNS